MTVWAGLFVVVAAMVILPPPASSQGRQTISKPDFPCGEPYGRNGELPENSRRKRQIVFPDEPKYADLLKLLFGAVFTRSGENVTDITEPNKSLCGATVISDQFILTAGHCVSSDTKKITMVSLGDLDLTQEGEENSRVATYEIEGVFIHPNYSHDKPTRHHDVALIKTKTKIQFNDVVFPMCISDEIPPPGTIVVISGFGYYNATHRPDHLLEGNFTVMDTAECEDIYKEHGHEPFLRVKYPNLLQGTDVICARDEYVDACQGDSGGPVIREKNGKLFIEGVVSGGANCHRNFKSVLPGLYISIAKQIDFIDSHVYGSPAVVP